MYTKSSASRADAVFIPSNYRGNALYFESPECDREKERECSCEQSEKKQEERGECDEHSLLSKLLDGDGLILLAVGAVLLFSFFDKKHPPEHISNMCDDKNIDLLVVFVVVFLLLS